MSPSAHCSRFATMSDVPGSQKSGVKVTLPSPALIASRARVVELQEEVLRLRLDRDAAVKETEAAGEREDVLQGVCPLCDFIARE